MKKIMFSIAATALLFVSCSKEGYYDGGSFKGEYMAADMDGDMGEEKPSGDRFDEIIENDFIETAKEPVSTFSVDADGAAYAYMRRSINHGRLPDRNIVRIEEYLNYFTFDYPDPADGNKVALNAEASSCPWNAEHKLLRLGIKGKSLQEQEKPKANFVFLIDISGSMDSSDKLPLLKKGLITMLDSMRPDDRVAIVTYASGEKLLLKSTPVSEKSAIVASIKQLAARGATAGQRGMKMAYEEAEKNFIQGGNNRVIMGTDGDFNVGITGTDALLEFVQNYASKGIYLTVCGFGTGNLNDSMMERVSNSGNGTYEYIDSEKELTRVFVHNSSFFVSVANDCKTQVTFNPEAVASYRLLGYENRVLNNEDFENDKVDAAEIGSGQTITALYELVMADGYQGGTLGKFDFRYKEALGEESIPLGIDLPAVSAESSENFRFASALAAWGLTLRESKYKGSASRALALELANSSLGDDPHGYRREFVSLLTKAAQLNR